MKKPSTPKSALSQNWTLMLVGSHGQTRTFTRFKGFVIGCAVLVAAALLFGAGAAYLYASKADKSQKLQQALVDSQKQMKALKKQKELLAARLVLNGIKVDDILDRSRAAAETAEAEPSQPSDSAAPPVSAQKERAKQRASDTDPEKPEQKRKRLLNPDEIGVEKFRLSFSHASETLTVRFNITNNATDGEKLSGHAVVVLKADETNQNTWRTLPETELVAGKPTGEEQGQSFSIHNFKRMRFKATDTEDPTRFKVAVVFIFDESGNLVKEREFSITLDEEEES